MKGDFKILNLRRTFWKEDVYSCSYRWGSDVPLFTNILALWNPLGSGKKLNVLGINLGVSASSSISVISQVVLFTNINGATDLTLNLVKYDPNAPNSIAKIYGGGILTLGNVLDRRTINFSNGMPMQDIDFKQEFEISQGNGLCVVHEAETSGNSYLPFVTFNWWE